MEHKNGLGTIVKRRIIRKRQL